MTKLLGTLGLCRRAGKLVIGTPMVCEKMRAGRSVCYVFYASDVSDATVKKLQNKCSYYGIPILKIEASREMLGKAVGKSGAVAAVALTDAGFLPALHLTDRKGRE